MIGFGNPLLDGDPQLRPWEADWANLARQKQACGSSQKAKVARAPRGAQRVATTGGRGCTTRRTSFCATYQLFGQSANGSN